MDYPKIVFCDGIGRAHPGANGIVAMHTHLNGGLYGGGPFHIIDVDHALMPVRLAFGTGHFTGPAAYATLHIHEKLHFGFKSRRLHALDFELYTIPGMRLGTVRNNAQRLDPAGADFELGNF